MLLKAEDITFRYTEKSPLILNHVSLQVEEGERVGIVGPSGYGKSTLARVLAGYEKPSGGRVVLADAGESPAVRDKAANDDQDFAAGNKAVDNGGDSVIGNGSSGGGKSAAESRLADSEVNHAGSSSPQSEIPLPGKGFCPVQMVYQHPELAVNPRWKMRKILNECWEPDQELLDKMGIEPSWLDRWPAELSGGELQRFCIARALSPKTRFLICDEITTMLDVITQAQIWQLLLDVSRSRKLGMIIITHNQALAEQVCTRIIDLPGIN